MNSHKKITFLSLGFLIVALTALDASTRSHKRYRSASPTRDVHAVIKEEILAPIKAQLDASVASIADDTQALGRVVGEGATNAATRRLQANAEDLSAAVKQAITEGLETAVASLTAERIATAPASSPKVKQETIEGKVIEEALMAGLLPVPTVPSDETHVVIKVNSPEAAPRPTHRQRITTAATDTIESIKKNIVLPNTFVLSRSAQEVKNVMRGLDDAARTKIATYILHEGISVRGRHYELTPELVLEAFYHDSSTANPEWNLLVHDIILAEPEEPSSTLRKIAGKTASTIAWALGKPTALQQAIKDNDLVTVFKLHISDPEGFYNEVNAQGLDDMNDATPTMCRLVDALFKHLSQILGKK